MSPIDEKFLGHAAANDAGAAHPMLLRDRHFRSMGGRDTRRPNAARSRTNYEEVIIIVAPAKNSRCRTGIWRRMQWVTDRKSVVAGKSVSVRVDFGGRRII